MKKIAFTFAILLASALSSTAQRTSTSEKYGNTLNVGLGVGYYGYIGQSIPAAMLNYEFDVFKNFTLAPFIGVYSHRSRYNWKDNGNYYYRETYIPVGLKGTYYFDNLLRAGSRWDFYVAGSAGAVYRSVTWDPGYDGDKYPYKRPSPLYLDAHAGAEFHITSKLGVFLDLSTGMSTIGLGFHF